VHERLDVGLFGIVMVDVDRFKFINDIRGHGMGDLTLGSPPLERPRVAAG
jgi:GGDEF domain-containing protein